MGQYYIDNIKDLREMVKELTNHDRLSHDTETCGPEGIGGLYPFHGSRSFAHVFATKEDEYYVDFNRKINWKYKQELQPIFNDASRIIYYVNALFDGSISHFDGLVFKNRILDGPSIARIEYNKHGKNDYDDTSFLSLDYLTNYYQVQKKIDEVKNYIEEMDLYQKDENGDYIRNFFDGDKIPEYQKVPLWLMKKYGWGDARSTYDVCDKIIRCINYKDKKYNNEKPMIEVAKNEIELTSVLLEARIKGIRHDDYYTKKAIGHEEKVYEGNKKEIDKITGGINLNSSKQVAQFLLDQGCDVPIKKPTEKMLERSEKQFSEVQNLKAELKNKKLTTRQIESRKNKIKELTKKAKENARGNYKTDSKTLQALINKYENLGGIDKLSKAKKALKKLNTYYRNFLLLQDSNKYIHAELNQEAAKTGRFSCSKPNLQNLHKESWINQDGSYNEYLIRKSFIADKGCRLFFCDYSQQEMIVMLDQAGEMAVIEKLKSGEYKDFYLAVQAIVKELLNIEMSRYDIKQICLALAYGLGLESLGRQLGFITNASNEEEIEEGKKKVKEFKDNFFKALPKLKRFEDRLKRQAKLNGYIVNAFGRVIYLDKGEEYKALNAFVQSTSADITKKSIVDVNKLFKENNLQACRFTISIHDENCFNISTNKKEEALALELIKEAMEGAYKPNYIGLKVDFEVSNINKRGVSPWGEKVDYAA